MTWLKVNSLDELLQNEKEITKRINSTPNGGYLFMTNPLMLLADIGVELSSQARNEIIKLEPKIETLSPDQYKEAKNRPEEPSVHFNIKGLFRVGASPP